METKRNYKYDPVEDTPEYQAIKDELEAKILERMGGEMTRGNAYMYAGLKKEILKKEMENAVSLLVPLGADVGVGSNWFLAVNLRRTTTGSKYNADGYNQKSDYQTNR